MRLFYFAMIMFILIGGGVVFNEFYSLKRSFDSKDWPSVKGEILDSSIIVDNSYNSSRMTYYEPYVEYKYYIGKKGYISYTISFFNEKTTDKEDVQEIIDEYPVGKRVDVFYNIEKPYDSVLVQSGSNFSFGTFIIGSILFMLGFLGLKNRDKITV